MQIANTLKKNNKMNIEYINILPYILYSCGLFCIGMLGLFFRYKNMIIMLMCIELMLLSSNINLIVFSVLFNDVLGQLFVLFVITVAAAESAIGLAIIIIYHKIHNTIGILYVNLIKG